LVESAVRVFAEDLALHVHGAPCFASTSSIHWVAVPEIEHESALVWE
jgi:hypothetical protein